MDEIGQVLLLNKSDFMLKLVYIDFGLIQVILFQAVVKSKPQDLSLFGRVNHLESLVS